MSSTGVEPRSDFYASQGLRLHYATWGQEDAAPVLLVHGGYDHCRSWDWIAAELAPEWYLIGPDLRGHGDSQWDSGGAAYLLLHYLNDLAALVDHLEIPRLRLIGHSFGGYISLLYTALFPQQVERTVAIDPFIYYTPQQLDAQQQGDPAALVHDWRQRVARTAQKGLRYYPSVAEATARMAAEHPHLSAAQLRHLTEHGLVEEKTGFRWKYDPALGAMPPQFLGGSETKKLWSSIQCPVLLIRGDECGEHSDPERNGALQLFADARSVTIPGGGHWIHHNQQEKVMEALRRFL